MHFKGSRFLHRPVNDVKVLGECFPRNDRYFPAVEIDVSVEFSTFSNCEQGIPKSGRRDHTLAGHRRPKVTMRTPTVTPKRRAHRNGDCRFFFHTLMIAKTPEGVNTPEGFALRKRHDEFVFRLRIYASFRNDKSLSAGCKQPRFAARVLLGLRAGIKDSKLSSSMFEWQLLVVVALHHVRFQLNIIQRLTETVRRVKMYSFV